MERGGSVGQRREGRKEGGEEGEGGRGRRKGRRGEREGGEGGRQEKGREEGKEGAPHHLVSAPIRSPGQLCRALSRSCAVALHPFGPFAVVRGHAPSRRSVRGRLAPVRARSWLRTVASWAFAVVRGASRPRSRSGAFALVRGVSRFGPHGGCVVAGFPWSFAAERQKLIVIIIIMK